MTPEKLREKLGKKGLNRDVEIDKKVWDRLMESEHRSSESLAALEHRSEPTFRDNRVKRSIELKDYRWRKMQGDFVAELEHYNPEFRPLMHILVDFPLWLWRNRIKNWGPVTR
ncbi:MAG: hypothetical protein ABEJ72_10935 [Candidatus Aenigmatarchaeota archaeon]